MTDKQEKPLISGDNIFVSNGDGTFGNAIFGVPLKPEILESILKDLGEKGQIEDD
jgi:hypothetical protein